MNFSIILHLGRYDVRCAVQSGKEIYLSSEEIKIFFAINIIMAYTKYPSCRMYRSLIPGLRCDLIADAMSSKIYLHISSST